MNELSPQKRDIAMVFQFYALYPALTVGQNIAMPLHYENLSKSETDARVMKVAKIMHLDTVLDRMPNQISEGEKQRLAVARAIVRDPNCFLFDEPLSRLDVELRHSMRGQIKEVLTGLSKATVIVTHDQLEALTMANRIAIMKDGLIEQVGTPHDVFAKPVNVFVASFIGTPQMNLVEAELKGFGDGMASVMLAGQYVASPPIPPSRGSSRPRSMIGIRPRAFTAVQEKARRHHCRPGRADRADGCGNAHPRAHRNGRRHSRRRAARQAGEGGRGAAPAARPAADACLRRGRKGGARMSKP